MDQEGKMDKKLQAIQSSAAMEPIPAGVEPQLLKLDGIKAVIFDVYGTLFISGSGDVGTATATDSSVALNEALEAGGWNLRSQEAGSVGKTILKQEILNQHTRAKERGIAAPEVEIRQIWSEVIGSLVEKQLISGEGELELLAVEYESRVNPVYPMPELRETIKKIRSEKYHLGIVSNAQFYTPHIFQAFLNASVADLGFDEKLCVWSYQELRGKPDDMLFLKLLRNAAEYDIKAEQMLYVGNDMLNDIWTASICGLKTCLYAADKRSLRLRENIPACANLQPDAVVTSLSQVLRLI